MAPLLMLTADESMRYARLRQTPGYTHASLDTDAPRPPVLARIVTQGAVRDVWGGHSSENLRALLPTDWSGRALRPQLGRAGSSFGARVAVASGAGTGVETGARVDIGTGPGAVAGAGNRVGTGSGIGAAFFSMPETFRGPADAVADVGRSVAYWVPLNIMPGLREVVRVAGGVAVLRRSEFLSRLFHDERRLCGAARQLLSPGSLLPRADPRRTVVENQLASFEHARRVLKAAQRAERMTQTSAALELACIGAALSPLLAALGAPMGATIGAVLGAAAPLLVLSRSAVDIRHYAERWADTLRADGVTWARARRSAKHENTFALGELAFRTLIATSLLTTSGLFAAGLIRPLVSGICTAVGVVGTTVLQTLYGNAYRVPSDVAYADTVFCGDTDKQALDDVLAREEKRHGALRDDIIMRAPWPRRYVLKALLPLSYLPIVSAVFVSQLTRALDKQGEAGATAVLTAMHVGCENRIALDRDRLSRLFTQLEACQSENVDLQAPAEAIAAWRAACALEMAQVSATIHHLESLEHVRRRIEAALTQPNNVSLKHAAAMRWAGMTQRSSAVVNDAKSFTREAVLAPREQARADRQALRWSARHARHAGEAG